MSINGYLSWICGLDISGYVWISLGYLLWIYFLGYLWKISYFAQRYPRDILSYPTISNDIQRYPNGANSQMSCPMEEQLATWKVAGCCAVDTRPWQTYWPALDRRIGGPGPVPRQPACRSKWCWPEAAFGQASSWLGIMHWLARACTSRPGITIKLFVWAGSWHLN